ncbi:MAG: M23 family metallopeptidase [Allosphingosinicella sp.]
MRDHSSTREVVTPSCLDEKSGFEWRRLSAQVLEQRRTGFCSGANVTLEAAIEREPRSPLAGAYRLWIADNVGRDGRLGESLSLFDEAVSAFEANDRLVETIDGVACALLKKAQTAALARDIAAAVEAYRALARHEPQNADPLFQAGLLTEEAGDRDRAAEFYKTVASEGVSGRTDDPAELARRCLERLAVPDSAFSLTAEHVADSIEAALCAGRADRLRALASTTHFAIGPAGGHVSFETPKLLDQLCSDLGESEVHVGATLSGGGDKRYLHTSGWRGRWFRGELVFLVARSARGWQWTGCAIATPNALWLEHWRPAAPKTNQPLPFELLAPWPDGLCCMAGGLGYFIRDQATILFLLGFAWPFGAIAAAAATAALAARTCGFGPRGFYYNESSTHDEDDAFAIDFTRYQRFVPYINRSEGTPVLAPRGGIVSHVADGTPSGSSTASNTVEIQHGDPNVPSDTNRFTSRYLHLQGPGRIDVLPFMPIFTGNRIGRMDDTGNSALSHLHFSIHDRQIVVPGSPRGGSVRPTPMNGLTLEDGESGKCICSTNVETFGEKPMILPSGFAGQNWVIVPVATAAGQPPPANIRDQRWQLVLSGVVLVDMKGVTTAQWRRETLLIAPDLRAPIKFAGQRFGVPLPNLDDSAFHSNFQVEQWAPFSTLSSVFNANQSINSGFAVDVWRPNPFFTATDLATNAQVSNLFAGIQADIAVRDSDAYIYRIGYHITLIGRIVFSPVIIT